MRTEVEFELPASQYALMGYPRLTQGQPLSVILDAGILLPDPAANYWFAVQKEPLPHRFLRVGRGLYAFTGQIEEADIVKEAGMETATLLVRAENVWLRVACAPQEDGRLPYGTWETRTLTGLAPLQGIVEDDFTTSIGRPVGLTIWRFRRLLLTPGDVRFGEWHESAELPDSPYQFDRMLLEGRLHWEHL